MTHSKLDETIEDILERYRIWEMQAAGGAYLTDEPQLNAESAKQALLEAFEQSLPAEKTNNKGINEAWSAEDYAVEWRAGFNAYRNEAIKVIRGNDE
jgi:hypothetical protein